MNKKSFTLIELLVVFVVVGIIMLLLFPAFNRARESAKQSACASNLRQLAIMMELYIDEHDLRFPRVGNPLGEPYWFESIGDYTSDPNVFRCPSYPDHINNDPEHQSYAYNELLSKKHIDDILSPSQCMMLTDSFIEAVPVYVIGYGETVPTLYYVDYNHLPGARHLNGANILFVDSHVKWHRLEDVPMKDDVGAKLWWNY